MAGRGDSWLSRLTGWFRREWRRSFECPSQGREWLTRMREHAHRRFEEHATGGLMLCIGLGVMFAFFDSRFWRSAYTLLPSFFDIAVGVIAGIIWLRFGWPALRRYRDHCRQHVRGVIQDTELLQLVLSPELAANHARFGQEVFGPARHIPTNSSISFRKRMQAFLEHYGRSARIAGHESFPRSLTRIKLGVDFLGGITWIVCWSSCSQLSNPKWGPTFWWLLVISSVAAFTFANQVLVAVRRTALELAATDVLLGEGEE